MAKNMLFLVKYSFGKDHYVKQQSSYSMNESKIIIDTWQLHQYNCLKNIMHVPRENKNFKIFINILLLCTYIAYIKPRKIWCSLLRQELYLLKYFWNSKHFDKLWKNKLQQILKKIDLNQQHFYKSKNIFEFNINPMPHRDTPLHAHV